MLTVAISRAALAARAAWRPHPPSLAGAAGRWLLVAGVAVALGTYAVAVTAGAPRRLVPLLLLAAAVPFVAMVVGSAQRLLLGLALFDIPLQLDVNLHYQVGPADLGALGGLNISLTTIALIGLYALWLAARAREQRNAPRLALRGSRALAVYVAAAALSMLVASNRALALDEVALLVQTFLLYTYLIAWTRTRGDVTFVVGALVAGLVLESVAIIGLGAAGQILDGIASRADAAAGPGGSVRYGGTIGSPNNAGAYLALMILLAIGVLLTRGASRLRILAAVAIALGLPALVLTLSRGAWLGFAAGGLVLIFVAARRRWLRGGALPALAVGMLVAAAVFAPTVIGRLTGNDNGAAQARGPLVQLALRVIEHHPLTGVGANNFAVAFPAYVTPDLDRAFLYVVHNKYLLVWSEVGPLGLLAFVAFLAGAVRQGLRTSRTPDRLLAPIALGLAAGVVAHATHMWVEVFHGRPQVQLLWVAAALIVAIANMSPEERAP